MGRQPKPATGIPQASMRSCWGERAALALLVVLMTTQMWTSIRQLSVTSDEIDHVHAGYRYLQCADFGWNPEHPPLVKLAAALPLAGMRVNDPIAHACGLPSSRDLDFRRGHDFLFANPESMLTRARMAASIFTILLLVTTYFFARNLFGVPVALIASTLIAFEPNLLGHGSLVATDVPAAFGFLLAIYALWSYVQRPGALRMSALGLAIGLALIIKYSAVLLIGIVPLLMVIDLLNSAAHERLSRGLRHIAALALTALIALVVLWAAYGFRYAARPNAATAWTNDRIEQTKSFLPSRVIPELEHARVLPQAYLIGLQDVLVESELGRRSFLLGANYLGGRWYYFPVATAIKFTLPFLAAVFISIAAFRFWREHRRELLFLMLPVLLIMLTGATLRMNIGVRHIFPVIPLLAILAAAGIWNLHWRRRTVVVIIAVLLFAHLATSMHAFPDYISYGNELWGGSGNVYKYLANSNADWGQAQKMARIYVEQTRPASCFAIRTYANLNSDYAIPCGDLSELAHDMPPLSYTGTLIVSSSVIDMSTDRVSSLGLARIFKGLSPKAKLGGSALLVYEGTFNLGPIIAERLIERIGVDIHQPQDVLDITQIAARLDPTNLPAHRLMCQAYGYLGDFANEQAECTKLYELMQQNPYVSQWEKSQLAALMMKAGMTVPSSARHERPCLGDCNRGMP
jgi:Dolichyl-phosphate-mannose-protein mannosyltransferase